jgi:subtilase family serine protease
MTGWSLEWSLDVEWAYAMPPNAKIYLVEAASDYANDLLVAVDKASSLIAAAGGGVVFDELGRLRILRRNEL